MDYRNRRAFSLVEALIGITILIVGFLPVFTLITSGEKGAVETARSAQAAMRAHAFLEGIANLPFGLIPATGRVSEEEFLACMRKHKSLAGWFPSSSEEARAMFDVSVEVIEGERWKRIKVYVVDKAVSGASAGKRGELMLETLVVP